MDTNKLLDQYTKWLRNQYTIKSIDESVEIVTPFLNMNGDNMRMYTTPLSNNKIQLSDDGTILEDLSLFGIDVNSNTRKQIINRIRKMYSIDLIDDILSTTGNISDFPVMKQNLMSAMIQINDLSQTKKSNVENLFIEEVYSYLNKNDFGGLPRYPMEGKSGVDYNIAYTIPAKNKRPLRMIDFQHRITFNKVTLIAYRFKDILSTNSPLLKNANYSIIFNNDEAQPSEKSMKIATDANINLLRWNDKLSILKLR